MWPNAQDTADLVTFIKEILNGKLHFLYNEDFQWYESQHLPKGIFTHLFSHFAEFVEKRSASVLKFQILFSSNLEQWYLKGSQCHQSQFLPKGYLRSLTITVTESVKWGIRLCLFLLFLWEFIFNYEWFAYFKLN